MNAKILYKGYLIELFEFNGDPSWRVIKNINNYVELIASEYRTILTRDLMLETAKNYINGLLDVTTTLDDYVNLPLY